MKYVLSNEFIDVTYIDRSNTIITIWKKPTTSEMYREIFKNILEILIEHKAQAFIIDIYHQGIVGTENRLWLQNEIFPKTAASGLKKVAIITSNDIFSRYFTEYIKNGASTNFVNIEFQYFLDLPAAQDWILKEDVAV